MNEKIVFSFIEKCEHTCFWVDEDKLDQVQLFENHRMMLEKTI